MKSLKSLALLFGLTISLPACGGSTSSPPGAGGGGSGRGGSGSGGENGGVGGSAGGVGASAGTCADCGEARGCCDGSCVNFANDPLHCGDCDTTCGSGTYCTGGKCVEPPCSATCSAGAECCGEQCCGAGQLCCDPQGPIERFPQCVTPNAHGTCPLGCAPLCKCASPDTPIATPTGDIPIAQLRAGDLVYSVDGNAVKVVPILRVHRTAVRQHHVQRIELASGAVLEISGGHPTADGRSFADLHAGAKLDGVTITSATSIPYAPDFTYDILPASDTGAYFAAGLLIGSTLTR